MATDASLRTGYNKSQTDTLLAAKVSTADIGNAETAAGAALNATIDAGIDSPASIAPSTAWVGLTQPRAVAVGSKVYFTSTGDANELYLEEMSEQSGDGPLWHRRYFIGYAPNDVTKDDHNTPAVIIREGKPVIALWSGHGMDNVLRWRKSLVDIEDGIEFGDEQMLSLGDDDCTAYINAHVYGDDIYILHRTGPIANYWSISVSTDWADTFTHIGHLFSAAAQFYCSGAIYGDTLRIVSAGHPTIASDHNVYYAEIDLTSGDITESDGTVLGNLDGTSLPIAQASLELIASPDPGEVLSEAVVSGAPLREVFWTAADTGDIASTGRYQYRQHNGTAWQTAQTIVYVGDQGIGASWGAPHPPIEPAVQGRVIITRYASGSYHIEQRDTADAGANWTTTVIETSATKTQQAWPVDVLDDTDLGINVIANRITAYATYTDWNGSVTAIPSNRRISRWQPIGDTADRPAMPTYPASGLYLPGTSGNYISTPDSAALSPTGAQRLEVDVALTDWANGTAQQALLARYGYGGARSVKLFINSDGKPGISWSADGTAAVDLIPTPVLPFTDGERWQVRCDLIPQFNSTQYRVRFWYKRPSDTVWTHHSVTQVSSGALSVFDSSDAWEVGTRAGGTTDRATGTFYRASLMTIAGDILAEWRGDVAASPVRDINGNVWTINGSGPAFTVPA